MLTKFETWLVKQVNNARHDFEAVDPGESVDTMEAIRARKEILEQVLGMYIMTLDPADLIRLNVEGVI